MLAKFRSSLMAFFTTVLLVSLAVRWPEVRIRCLPGPVRPGKLDYRIELPQGYLKVYSVSDEFNDGAYYAHSSYAIYSIDGRLFKRVENNISRTDDLIPSQVALPLGPTRSLLGRTRGGEVRVHFVIKAGQRTIVQAIRNFSILPRLA
jgi:hypothetical protein